MGQQQGGGSFLVRLEGSPSRVARIVVGPLQLASMIVTMAAAARQLNICHARPAARCPPFVARCPLPVAPVAGRRLTLTKARSAECFCKIVCAGSHRRRQPSAAIGCARILSSPQVTLPRPMQGLSAAGGVHAISPSLRAWCLGNRRTSKIRRAGPEFEREKKVSHSPHPTRCSIALLHCICMLPAALAHVAASSPEYSAMRAAILHSRRTRGRCTPPARPFFLSIVQCQILVHTFSDPTPPADSCMAKQACRKTLVAMQCCEAQNAAVPWPVCKESTHRGRAPRISGLEWWMAPSQSNAYSQHP